MDAISRKGEVTPTTSGTFAPFLCEAEAAGPPEGRAEERQMSRYLAGRLSQRRGMGLPAGGRAQRRVRRFLVHLVPHHERREGTQLTPQQALRPLIQGTIGTVALPPCVGLVVRRAPRIGRRLRL